MADFGRIPRLIMEASAIRSLRMSAADGFVLSRIDGRATEKELASLTGLPESQIRVSIDNLLALKVIAFGAPPPVAASRPALGAPQSPASAPQLGSGATNGAPSPESAPKLEPAPAVANALLDAAVAGIPDDSPELHEDIELTPDLRRRVLGLHSVAASLDHYALLGLTREADKKAVKRAYFELAALYHPDRYFRKNIGTFKSKMEVIFAKVSVAYETLADKGQRAEYDLYLGDVEKSRDVEAMLRNVMAEVETAEQTAIDLAQSSPSLFPPTTSPSLPPTPTESQPGTYSVPRPAAMAPLSAPAAPPSAPQRSAVADQLRREALAARLKGNRPVTKPPIDVKTVVLPPPPRSNPAEAVDSLKRRYEDRVEAGRRAQGDKYVKIGESAESRNDLTAAAAAYRVALSFLREGDETFAHAKEVIAKSETALGETYTRQAEHEEKGGKWEDALRSWGRAAKFRPNDPHVLERHAHAILKNAGDLREALQVAQKAVSLAPTVGEYRCTLVNLYVAAGLALNARRELDAAAKQFPDNPTIAALVKKLQQKPT